MPKRRASRTIKLPNGNRVTVSQGRGRWNTSFSKTVTVRRPDGTGESRSYRRGIVASSTLGSYGGRVPVWARRGGATTASRAQQPTKRWSFWKGIGIVLLAILYLCWPILIGSKTVNGHEHYSVMGEVLLCIWLPLAIGVPVFIWQRPRLVAKREAERAARKSHIEKLEQELGMTGPSNTGTGRASPATPSGSAQIPFVRAPASSELVAEIRDAEALVIDALRNMAAAGTRQFQAMIAWPVEGPFSADQISDAQRQSWRYTAESEELSAILKLRTRVLSELVDRASAAGIEVTYEAFLAESATLKQSIGDSARRIAALAKLYHADDPPPE